jgi:group I intron endonuclease
MACVYSLTFSSGKQYIGMTSELLRRRLAIHRRDSKTKPAYVYRAWRKYGDPEIKVLAVVEEHMLRDTERKAIAVFKTLAPHGYNLVHGGEGGGTSEYMRRMVSLRFKGKKLSPETRAKMSAAQFERFKNSPNPTIGRKRTPEQIEKTASWHRGRKRSKEFCARMSEVAKRQVRTPELNAKVSETMKRKRAEHPELWKKLFTKNPS